MHASTKDKYEKRRVNYLPNRSVPSPAAFCIRLVKSRESSEQIKEAWHFCSSPTEVFTAMSSTSLLIIRQEMIRYGMTTYLALGLFGNICDAGNHMRTIRLSRRPYSSVYFLALSLFSMIYLMWTAFPAIYTLYYVDY